MPTILAIDSSTEACSVALTYQGETFLRYEVSPRKHAELLLPMVDSLLREVGIQLGQVDAFACCVGPGAFTGLRIAISVVQGLAFATQKPCIAIDSLSVLANQCFANTEATTCLSAIDARMNEVYFGAFCRGKNNRSESISQLVVCGPKQLPLSEIKESMNGLVLLTGSGWNAYDFEHSMLERKYFETSASADLQPYPSAKHMIVSALYQFENQSLLKPADLQPIYLRNNVAVKKSSQN